MIRLIRRIGWCLMAFLAIGIALAFVPRYLLLNPAISAIHLNPAVALHFPILVLHAATGGLALMIGPFQFLSPLRAKYPGIHRILGRIYLICILLGGLAALFSAISSTSGFVAQLGFCLLAVLWLYSAYRAYAAIRQSHIQLHRLWMMRNYALTFAAVTLRLWLGIGAFMLHFPITDVYDSSAWISWIAPLILVEWFINQRLLQAVTAQKDRQLLQEKKTFTVSKETASIPARS